MTVPVLARLRQRTLPFVQSLYDMQTMSSAVQQDYIEQCRECTALYRLGEALEGQVDWRHVITTVFCILVRDMFDLMLTSCMLC